MTANDMTKRDAAQTAALPKSAVWSRLQSRGLVDGRAGARSLTSERTDHTSSPATSGGRPKRLPLTRAERTCEEAKAMNTHTQHELAAGVALTGGSGGGCAVWHDGLPGGGGTARRTAAASGKVAGRPPRPDELERHAGRAVLVTACACGTDGRGGRPAGVHPSSRTSEAGAKGWTPSRRSPLPARAAIGADRGGGLPKRIHPSRPPRHGTAGWTPTSDVHSAFLPQSESRHGAAGWTPTADVHSALLPRPRARTGAGRTPTPDGRPASLPLAPEDRFGVREQHALPLALGPQPLDLVAQDLDVLQRLEGRNQTFLLRTVLPRGREEQQLLVGIDVEVNLTPWTSARTTTASRLLTGRRLRWVAGQGGLRLRELDELGSGLVSLARRGLYRTGEGFVDRPRPGGGLGLTYGRDLRRLLRLLGEGRRRRLRIVLELLLGVR